MNPYEERVWRYVVGIGAAAAKAGFDEAQFDYARFPSDGDYTLIEVTDQIASARRQHTAGYLLWNPEGVYTREALSD